MVTDRIDVVKARKVKRVKTELEAWRLIESVIKGEVSDEWVYCYEVAWVHERKIGYYSGGICNVMRDLGRLIPAKLKKVIMAKIVAHGKKLGKDGVSEHLWRPEVHTSRLRWVRKQIKELETSK